jgi:ATP-dependent DNA ligase
MITLINPVSRATPFDNSDWIFELKFDGFRAATDTVRGRLISRNGHWLKRFEGTGCVFDEAGRPLFDKLLFGRGRPTYVTFDLLETGGVDLRPLPLRDRKAREVVVDS